MEGKIRCKIISLSDLQKKKKNHILIMQPSNIEWLLRYTKKLYSKKDDFIYYTTYVDVCWKKLTSRQWANVIAPSLIYFPLIFSNEISVLFCQLKASKQVFSPL